MYDGIDIRYHHVKYKSSLTNGYNLDCAETQKKHVIPSF